METILLTNPSRHTTATHVGRPPTVTHLSYPASSLSSALICYGFEVMRSCESPKHPFSIFLQRFQKAPQVIVYDNACKLHQYCLNREPHFFRSTLFAVDRFHWQGHVGCSAGYCLNGYKQMAIKDINSQVNEQANAGLQRIRGQLAYNTPENFMFTLKHFLSLKNKDVERKLDMSTLRV